MNGCRNTPSTSPAGMNQGFRHELKAYQRCGLRFPPLSAGRRAPGGSGSGSGSSTSTTKGRVRPEPPRKSSMPPIPAAPVPHEPDVVETEQVEVPSMGWMWQVGSSNSKNNAAGAGGAARDMPSAATTVANLYGDRIKAKK